MKSATTTLRDALRESHTLYATPRLIAEWNHNRYAGISSVDNVPSEANNAYDSELFPITSIVEPNRPSKQGLVRARVGTSASTAEGFVASDYVDPHSTKYYIVDVDDKYKYWISPFEATVQKRLWNGSSWVLQPYWWFPQVVQPTVLYTNSARTNKIVVQFEGTFARPTKWSIDITTNGTTWSTISTDATVSSTTGRVTLYRQANGTWASTTYRDNPINIKGVRLRVQAINKQDSSLQLIELSARLEADLSSDVISYDTTSSMSETNFITPIGRLSSNEATVVLGNFDGTFDYDNPSSPYYKLIDKNVKMTMDIVYDRSKIGGSGTEAIRQFTMYTEEWPGQGEEEISVRLKDHSKFLQETKPLRVLYENLTLAEIVWRLCDMIGFVDYNIELNDRDMDMKIPYFWTDGDETVWEIFSSLAESTQSAIYFDEYGVLQIRDRGAISGQREAIDWPLDAEQNGDKLADIIEASSTFDHEANSVKINYQVTKVSEFNNGLPKMEKVWEPESTLTLRAAHLIHSMDATQDYLRMDPAEASVWSYNGMMQIEGELISYESKGYYYYDTGGVKRHVYLKNSADYQKYLNESSPTLRYKNAWSGYFGGVERGLWNTKAAGHYTNLDGYLCRFSYLAPGTTKEWGGGWKLNRTDGYATLATNKTFTPNHIYIASRGKSTDSMQRRWGTRLRFQKGKQGVGSAGIAIAVGTNDAAYHIELTRTAYASKTRSYHNEVMMYRKNSSGQMQTFGKGGVQAIEEGIWYNLDVTYIFEDNLHKFSVLLNGVVALTTFFESDSIFKVPHGGRCGVFVRGNTTADFEYFYAVQNPESPIEDESGTVLDLIQGGFTTKPFVEYTFNTRRITRIVKGQKRNYSQAYDQVLFDEFGPIIHEVRETEVKFENAPVIHSNLYFSNESQAVCPEYISNPFGARFVLVNASRNNAIMQGEDTLTFGADNPVDQVTMIYGRLVNQEDEKEYVVKNADAIRARGEVESEISSKWIQSEEFAKSIGDWIALHWAGGNDEMEVTVFGNPLFELLDVVTVNYPERNLSASTHKYFIVGIRQSYSEGLETTLTLRRAKLQSLISIKEPPTFIALP